MQMAIGGEGEFRGVVDLVEMRVRDGEEVGGEVGAAEMESASVLRQELVECVADVDDGVMELWMEERPVPADVLRTAVRAACARREIVPVFYAAALKDVGVREVMDAAVEYLPSPAERPAIKAVDEKGGTLQVAPVADGPLLAQAFKVTHDRHRGRLVHFRAFAGEMTDRKLPLWNCNKEVKERPSKWLRVLADDFREVEHIECGDVFAMVSFLTSVLNNANLHPMVNVPMFVCVDRSAFGKPKLETRSPPPRRVSHSPASVSPAWRSLPPSAPSRSRPTHPPPNAHWTSSSHEYSRKTLPSV